MPTSRQPDRPQRLRGLRHRSLVVGAVAVAAVATAVPVAGGFGEGSPLEGGVRNPSANPALELERETQIIADTPTYGTRQSNKSNSGGGAIYGCRSGAGGTVANNEPCIRANNLEQGFAFEFETDGAITGLISAGGGGPNTKPFATNATGVASGLNADFVDGQEFDAAAVAANGQADARTTDQIATAKTATGTYRVDFPAVENTTCYYQATARSGPGFVVVQGQAQPVGRAIVTTFAPVGTARDAAFYITAQCTPPAASTTG